jgi:hypothetical protein
MICAILLIYSLDRNIFSRHDATQQIVKKLMDANQRWTNHIFPYYKSRDHHLFIINPNHPMPSSSMTLAGTAVHPHGSSEWFEEGQMEMVSEAARSRRWVAETVVAEEMI